MRDLFSKTKVVTLWDPIDHATGNTATVSEIIDMQGYNSCLLIVSYGSIADADVTFTPLLEEGSDSALADNTTVAAADMNGTIAGFTPLFSDDNTVFKLGYCGSKRYIRLTITPANNTGALLWSGVAVLGNLNNGPDTTQKR